MDPYQYQRINLGRPSIRLLQLYKGDWSEKIQGHFVSAWFDEPDSIIPYLALSYTWGNIDKVEEVIIDSARIKVTSNLHMALQHLRSGEEDQIFWIDALCINQENVHEKIHQIRQMGDIYKKAEKVVVWLGQGTEETDLVMDSMKRLRKASLGWNSAEWKDKANGWVDENNEHLENSREQMRLILQRPWFRRIWILQEVANARRATTVHCGNRSITVTIFSQFPALIALTPAVHCQSVLDIMPGILRKETWWRQGQKLQTLLVKFRESEATDDRDKIYALLGISSDAHRSNILDPKCDKSSQQVIREAVSFILSEKYPQLKDDASLYQFLDWNSTKFLDNVEDLEGAMLTDAFQGAEEEFLKLFIETDVCQISSRGFHDRVPVHWAIQKDRLTILKMLLDAYLCSFEKKDSDKQKPLSLAIQAGNARIVELVLNAGIDIEATCFNGFTPLFLAIEKNNIEIVELLLRKGAKCKAQNMSSSILLSQESNRSGQSISPTSSSKNQLPLPFAIEKGNYGISKLLFDRGASLRDGGPSSDIECGVDKMVEFLIDHGIGTDEPKPGMRLQLAAKLGNVKLTGEFIKRGFALESKDGYGQTPLMLAVIHGHYETIKLLLKSGAEIHSKDVLNQTPLTIAIENGNQEIVKLLLARGAGIHSENSFATSLMIATENGNKEVVELLLQNNFDFERKDAYGQTPLIAAIKHRSKEVVELLLQNGVDFERKDEYGQTPLIAAIKHRSKEVVELLLQNGVDFERKDEYGETPLMAAIENGNNEVVELLLQRGADIEVKDNIGRTALSLAASYKILKAVQLLLENGAELETIDHEGETPLQKAIDLSYIVDNTDQNGIVTLLLENGAELETRDREGKTPLQNAIVSYNFSTTNGDRKEIIMLLLENGAELETRDREGKTPLQNLKASNWENETIRREFVALLLEWGAIDMDEE
ncbi:uncharacterized protein EAE97_011572 [Botrytis byssoidea]|uniref:Heterokaryon incompatibility domain-containing protein n=1 Tax=Botrytis byssoidea TaxID=139641 RepID=A0A9P5HWI4_9HELO|nr:uncharacterized protein EAE97_011572 [Botrytis byssoidea]KAF7920231.1 hypothetical protein EAE97_011572 [Botrytis byssoidea]